MGEYIYRTQKGNNTGMFSSASWPSYKKNFLPSFPLLDRQVQETPVAWLNKARNKQRVSQNWKHSESGPHELGKTYLGPGKQESNAAI